MIAQLILALTILVAIHEFGHFAAAKYFKMRVDKFFIFFDPWFNLGSKKIGDTKYGLGWLPLGGYVKIAGMIDESMDKEQLKQEPKEWEFRSKSTFARLIVMIGGVVMNIILGMAIFSGLIMANGVNYLPAEELHKHGIAAHGVAKEIGLETGDRIVAISGKPVERFSDIVNPGLILDDDVVLSVERGTESFEVLIPDDMGDRLADAKGKIGDFITPRMLFGVKSVAQGSNADKGGLEAGDVIISVNGTQTPYFDQFQTALAEQVGNEIEVRVDREGVEQSLTMTVDDNGLVGFTPGARLNYAQEYYGFFGSIAKGSAKAWGSLFVSIKGMGKVFSGKLSLEKSVSGPIGIAAMYGSEFDATWFWTLTAVLSMWLAFINIVPIPALDGGHVVFLLYEMIAGRKPGDKFMEVMQMIGLVIILSLMVFVIGLDVSKLFN
jgi:regulator of sigma E protease